MWPFKEKLNLNKEVDKVHENVSSKIHSDRVARQFILEELDAASNGDDKAKMFVSLSGFDKDEYRGAMSNSFNEVDGPGGPQQTLLTECMSYKDMSVAVEIRTRVVSKIIEQYRKGFFMPVLTSSEQKVIDKLMQLNAVNSEDEALDLLKRMQENNYPPENLIEMVKISVNQGIKLFNFIMSDNHKNIRNLVFFMNEEDIKILLEDITKNSVVNLVLRQEEILNVIKAKVDEVAHPMFAMVIDSVAEDLYFVAIYMSTYKLEDNSGEDFYTKISKKIIPKLV